ncbi:MAG: hypothetical protein KatS3mg014_0050 [Actinomycetota bacterium]|nr:MAG: hypothetical protein KatS3mg014_0050 [Actinomycetota bacterium]
MIRVSKRVVALITAEALMASAFLALAVIGAGPASAAGTCVYDGASQVVTIGISGGSASTLYTDATGAILLDGSPCGAANVSNTTQIAVFGQADTSEGLTISNNGGIPFPATISWQVVLDTGSGDWVAIVLWYEAPGSVSVTDSGFTMAGATGLLSGVELLSVTGGGWNDTIDGSALTATGPVFAAQGGEGADAITGGAGTDILGGGDGNDAVVGGGGSDVIRGGAGDDGLRGGSGNDELRGGTGDDELRGGRGLDACAGGPGTDVVRACES